MAKAVARRSRLARLRHVPRRTVRRVRSGLGRLSAGRRLLPDFVIIGAQRAGTTSVYRYLVAHPAVAAPLRKEIHYFDLHHHRGPGWYRSHFPLERSRLRFERRTGLRLLTGDASPYYVIHPRVPDRLARLIPEAKLIFLVRHPVDRAFSHYKHELRLGSEDLGFAEALDAEPRRLAGEVERLLADDRYRSYSHQRYTYLARGRYIEQVESWLERFDLDQFLILCSEEFFAEPDKAYAEVLDFIGLPDWTPERFEVFNATPPVDMNAATRGRLLEYFRPYNDRLYAFLGRRLPWDE